MSPHRAASFAALGVAAVVVGAAAGTGDVAPLWVAVWWALFGLFVGYTRHGASWVDRFAEGPQRPALPAEPACPHDDRVPVEVTYPATYGVAAFTETVAWVCTACKEPVPQPRVLPSAARTPTAPDGSWWQQGWAVGTPTPRGGWSPYEDLSQPQAVTAVLWRPQQRLYLPVVFPQGSDRVYWTACEHNGHRQDQYPGCYIETDGENRWAVPVGDRYGLDVIGAADQPPVMACMADTARLWRGASAAVKSGQATGFTTAVERVQVLGWAPVEPGQFRVYEREHRDVVLWGMRGG